MSINFNQSGGPGQGPLGRALAVIGGVLVLAVSLMFGLVVFAVLAVVVLCLWGYVWWKTRELRKVMRESLEAQQRAAANGMDTAAPESNGEVIEGEAVRVQDDPNRMVR